MVKEKKRMRDQTKVRALSPRFSLFSSTRQILDFFPRNIPEICRKLANWTKRLGSWLWLHTGQWFRAPSSWRSPQLEFDVVCDTRGPKRNLTLAQGRMQGAGTLASPDIILYGAHDGLQCYHQCGFDLHGKLKSTLLNHPVFHLPTPSAEAS